MKNILTITQNDFERCLYQLNFSTLKSLLEELFKFIKANHSKLATEQVCDLERKQTKIWKELQRRRHLNSKTNQEFMDWLYKKHKRRVY